MIFDGQPLRIEISEPGSPQYNQAVRLAQQVYRDTYQASIHPAPDCFLGCSNADTGALLACAGLSFGDNGALFSEQYLEGSLETALQGVFEQDVSRAKVVEVSSLATSVAQLGSEMVRVIPIACWYLGMQAILCTATQRLRKIFKLQRLPYSSIASPDPARLKYSGRCDWGSYYDTEPKTGVIRLDQIGHLFQTHCGKYDAPARPQAHARYPAMNPESPQALVATIQ